MAASFFVCHLASAFSGIRFNEIHPYPNSGEEEFVEIKNTGEEEVDISGWIIKDIGNHKFEIEEETILAPQEIKSWKRNFYLNNTGFEAIYLLNPQGEEIDGISYEKAKKGFSWSFLENGWEWTAPSQGEENQEDGSQNDDGDGDDEDPQSYSKEIRLSEILPNPSDNESEEEYIEIYNYSQALIDLFGWTLKDSSKTGSYTFPESITLESNKFLVLYRDVFGFAINNNSETVYLIDPNDEIVSQISFSDSAKEDVSYNFFGEEKWRWSTVLTTGEINQFDEFPAYKISLPKKIFKDVYADFEVEIDDEETKVKWNFGDEKTSTQRKARHKYEDTQTFEVALKLSSKSEIIEKKFKIEVEKFENEDIELVAILPNPEGPDADGEWIEIKNNGKKKVNLENWSLATGSSKLYNHPINEEVVVKGGKSKKIYRDVCSFSLGNKKGKVELRYPDGERVDRVKYEKDKIEENEVYQKIKGTWVWSKETLENDQATGLEEIIEAEIAKPIPAKTEGSSSTQKAKDFLGKQSLNKEKQKNKELYLKKGSLIQLSGTHLSRITPSKIISESKNFYSFNLPQREKHWLVSFLKKINIALNDLY